MTKTHSDRRRQKNGLGLTSSAWAVFDARQLGEIAATAHPSAPRRVRENPYPPGYRAAAWTEGFNSADPMGEWMGRNL